MDTSITSSKKSRRQFDRNIALHKAMEFFWRYGYETSSMADLLKAMSLKAPSFYAAFGSKESLFMEAVELYATTYSAMLYMPLDEPIPARAAIEKLLLNAAEIFSTPDHPAGCFLICTASTGSKSAAHITQEMKNRRAAKEETICRRLQQAIQDGELPSTVNPVNLAKYFNAVMQGINIQSRDGASSEELRAVAKNAMAVWPIAF